MADKPPPRRRGRGQPDDDRDDSNDDFRSERLGDIPTRPSIGTALISDSWGRQKAIQYVEVNGMAVVEGDIALGTVAEVEQATGVARDAGPPPPGVAMAVAITGAQFRWPNCRVPYEIDPNLPNQNRVTDAIAHWEANTALRFLVRTNDPNWLYFTDDGGCWSYVGMRGGRQTVSVGPNCSLGNTIHEIAHAVGLWHEQSREDRDTFVTINWQNIQTGMESQFTQHITDGDDIGAYDYGSIMHYPRKAFSKNNQETITPVDANAQIGQRNGLSQGDIAAVRSLYPSCGVIKPPWREPIKKLLDDRRFKKIFDDERWLKPVRDLRKPSSDPGPVKLDARPEIPTTMPTIPAVGGQLLRPFALATPHHAPPMAMEEQALSEAAGFAQALQLQLLEIDAAIAQAQGKAAEAAVEVARLQQARDGIEAAYFEAIQILPDADGRQG
jgi:Astacin (Peptidase family M12A)